MYLFIYVSWFSFIPFALIGYLSILTHISYIVHDLCALGVA